MDDRRLARVEVVEAAENLAAPPAPEANVEGAHEKSLSDSPLTLRLWRVAPEPFEVATRAQARSADCVYAYTSALGSKKFEFVPENPVLREIMYEWWQKTTRSASSELEQRFH